MKNLARLALVAVLTACNGAPPPTADAGADAGFGADGGPIFDPCASNGSPLETVGCNGGFAPRMPAPNEMSGLCTGASGATPSSCEGDAFCMGGGGRDEGHCQRFCDAGATLVSTGGCPTGFRCHRFAAPVPLCLRDCDAQHACPIGLVCDAGRCLEARP